MYFEWKFVPKRDGRETRVSQKKRQFGKPRSDVDFWMQFNHHLAPVGTDSGSFLHAFGSIWFPLTSFCHSLSLFRLHFWLPLMPWVTLSTLLVSFLFQRYIFPHPLPKITSWCSIWVVVASILVALARISASFWVLLMQKATPTQCFRAPVNFGSTFLHSRRKRERGGGNARSALGLNL